MDSKDNYKPLCMAFLFVLVGLIAPSNSVDDKITKSPLELLIRAFFIILSCVILFIMWKLISKKTYSNQVKTKKENI